MRFSNQVNSGIAGMASLRMFAGFVAPILHRRCPRRGIGPPATWRLARSGLWISSAIRASGKWRMTLRLLCPAVQ
jgi:hypothetical protein